MYDVPPQEDPLRQGDIFRGSLLFPYHPNLHEEIQIVREEQAVPAAQVENAWREGSEVVLIPAYRTETAIILSNTCEISGPKSPLEFATVAAIFSIDRIPNRQTRELCKQRNAVIRFHYLPEHEAQDFAESFVSFGLVALVHRERLLEFRGNRILTLRSPYRESLGHRYGEFIGRVAVP